MALTRAPLTQLTLGGLMALSLTLSGCPSVLAPEPPKETTVSGSEKVVGNGTQATLNIDGTIYGMADLTQDAVIRAEEPEGAEIDIPTGFRILQLAGARKLVQNAAVTLRGYDYKVVPLIPPKVSNEEGKFKFRSVPPHVAFFMEANYTLGGKTFNEIGLVRTGTVSDTNVIDIDLASTLVSRFLLRLMQYCATPKTVNHPIDFRDLDPKDYQPLLDDLRDLLAGGMPVGMTIDLTTVHQPAGDWTLEADKNDGAVVTLDHMRGYKQILFDMQRLADAVAVDARLFASPGKPLNILPPSAF